MALMIQEDCTACDVCVLECPNDAISENDGVLYVIDGENCTECVGHHDEPQCQLVCPAECIVVDPNRQESADELQAKYERLHA